MRLFQRFAVLACVLPIALGLTLHLLPHTHDDVGWLKTVDQYFMGTNNDFQEASVTYLLTGVMAALKRNPDRRFVYVEQAYFQRWWRRQNNEMKDLVRSFVKNGQLEFANGGWSMHDEATTHNVDMIDQTTLGHQFILEQFGESANPRIAWQIDCFGHSATQAVISSLSGMEALFFGRLDYQDFDRRMANKLMNLWWNPSQSLPDEKVWVEMALDGNYNPPDGFNYDYLVGGDNPPIQNDPRLEDLNVEDRIAAFMNQVNFYVAHRQGDFKTMNIAWMMGSDFHYSSSERNFLNMDKLIQIVNANTSLGVTVRYSTPSEYFNAKMAEKQVWPSKTDDFFPLIDSPNSVWTGYFSSRPGLKGLVRMSSVLLQTARQIDLFAGGDGSGVELLWEAIGVAQHHDAVTGTERQHVAYDYIRRLSVGREAAFQAIDAGMTKLINSGQSFTSCPLINISICAPISNSNHFTVALWNSEARPVSKLVQIPYYGSKVVKVRDASGKDIDSAQTRGVRTAAWTKNSAPNLISFQASLPAMGYSTFEVYVPSVDNSIKETVSSQSIVSDTILGNDFVQLTVSNATGLIQSWTDVKTGVVHTFSQNFYYYIPSEDSNFAGTNNYFFAVKENTGINKLSTSTPTVEVITTDLFVSLIQRWNDWLVQEVRIEMQATGPYVDFLWSVGPVDLDDGISKEVVTRYETDINSGKTFFTDSNGLELQKRILDYRPSFNWTAIAPIQSNYYPSTSLAGITDDNAGLYVVTDRAQGCSSQESGDLEFLVHRRMLFATSFGEALNETDGAVYKGTDIVERIGKGLIIGGRHRVVLAAAAPAIETARIEQQAAYRPPQAVFSASNMVSKDAQTVSSFAQAALPPNVEVQTLQLLFDGSILLRLAHSFAVSESKQYSVPVKVDLNDLFTQPIQSVTQTTLTANAKFKARSQLDLQSVLDDTVVTINPMQILTFVLTF